MNPLSTRPNRWRPITVFNLLVGLLFSLSALAQPAFLKEGLVAYYPFNGNANDESGSQRHLSFSNISLTSDRFGQSGKALKFNNTAASATSTGPELQFGNGARTLTFWLKSDEDFIYGKGEIIRISNPSNDPVAGTGFGIGVTPQNQGSIYVWGSYADIHAPNLSNPFRSKWRFVSIVYNNRVSETSIAIDGIQLATSQAGLDARVLSLNTAKGNIVIGGTSPSTLSALANALVDEVRIYNRALSGTEVKALYDYESTPPDNSFITNGLVAYYPFNGNANDESGNGKNGTQIETVAAPDRFGVQNQSLLFDKNKQSCVKIPEIDSNIGAPYSSLTISVWVSRNARSDGDNSSVIFSVVDGNPYEFVEMQLMPGGKVYRFYRVPAENHELLSTGSVSKNWSQVVYRIDAGSGIGSLFIDGIKDTSDFKFSPQIDRRNNSRKWVIGGMFGVSGAALPFFDGLIDDVRIYNRSLSDSEVKALYDYESASPVQSPVFVQQPVSQTVNSGDNVVLSVGLQTAGTYNYQWQLNEQNIAGATASSLAVNNSVAGIYRYRVIVSNSAGTVISDTATLTVSTPPAPSIVTQPAPKTVQEGANVSLNVVATGQGSLVYQWQFNEQNLPGATSATLNLNGAKLNTAGRYRVLVSSQYGVTISDTVTLTVNPNPPPAIVTQPMGKTVQEGANTSFNVAATGVGSLTYQWQFNEQNLPGATSATLNLNGVKLNTAGRYRVLVSSQYGVTISDTVTLTVNPNPPPTIVTQPLSRTPVEGTQVRLAVTATSLGSLTYQWQVNGQNIPGATSSTLVLSAVRPSVNGNYRVIVGNPYGTTISTEATVTVVVTDSDSDGLSDYEELLLGTNANKADSDGDGLSDFAEVRTHGSNPLTTDTDGDGYSDGIEVARDGNPNDRSVTPTGALAVFPAVDVEFYTLNSVKYQLEVSTDMVGWTAQGGVVVGNGGSQNHLVRASKATQFWRLKVVQ